MSLEGQQHCKLDYVESYNVNESLKRWWRSKTTMDLTTPDTPHQLVLVGSFWNPIWTPTCSWSKDDIFPLTCTTVSLNGFLIVHNDDRQMEHLRFYWRGCLIHLQLSFFYLYRVGRYIPHTSSSLLANVIRYLYLSKISVFP